MDKTQKGYAAGVTAFTMWGLFPIFWKQLHEVSPFSIIAYRIIWSAAFALLFLLILKRKETLEILKSSKKTLLLSALSGGVVTLNWFLYVVAINTDRVLEGSLGYFLNPLLNLLIGIYFFREKISRLQTGAFLLAGLGLAILVVSYGKFPWLAFSIASTFALYGVLRKISQTESVKNLFLETLILSVPAIGFLLFTHQSTGENFFVYPVRIEILLVLSGLFTTIPLLLFSVAARSVPLSAVGIMQYLAPSLQFLLGVFLYHEPVAGAKLVSFIFIWLALLLFSAESVRKMRSGTRNV